MSYVYLVTQIPKHQWSWHDWVRIDHWNHASNDIVGVYEADLEVISSGITLPDHSGILTSLQVLLLLSISLPTEKSSKSAAIFTWKKKSSGECKAWFMTSLWCIDLPGILDPFLHRAGANRGVSKQLSNHCFFLWGVAVAHSKVVKSKDNCASDLFLFGF